MITKKIFVIGTFCALISSGLCVVNAGSMKDRSKKSSGDAKGKQSAEKIAKREEMKKKFEELNKKLKNAETAINKISDSNTKIALKNIHEYLVGMAELHKKGAVHMKRSMNKKHRKGLGSRKNEGFPPSQKEKAETNQ